MSWLVLHRARPGIIHLLGLLCNLLSTLSSGVFHGTLDMSSALWTSSNTLQTYLSVISGVMSDATSGVLCFCSPFFSIVQLLFGASLETSSAAK